MSNVKTSSSEDSLTSDSVLVTSPPLQSQPKTLKLTATPPKRPWYSRGRFLFCVGAFLGTCVAYAAVPHVSPHVAVLLEYYDVPFTFPDMPPLSLPSLDISLPTIDFEFRQITNTFLTPAKLWMENRDFKVGEQLARKGYEAKHPIIIIPGVVSTGLESWSTDPEYRQYFRKRLWGTTTMIRAVVSEKTKWIRALSLDPITGLDPPGVKVRAAQGIDAASTFIPGYWIWQKLIENLAVINYDTNNLFLASYDWRLSYYNLEVRDGYFSRLKSTIESFKQREGRKVVLVGHSMGATVTTYFLKWVEAENYGGGGPRWVEDHIEAVIAIAGTHLGVPKAMTAFLSGEMKDTVEMNPAGAYVLEKLFSRKERADLFRSWAGSASMWIKGGSAIWGNSTFAPDDHENCTHSHGSFLSFRANPSKSGPNAPADVDREPGLLSTMKIFADIPSRQIDPDVGNLTVTDASNFVLEHAPETWQRMMETNYSYGIERDIKQLRRNGKDHRKWTNPLEISLPEAPSMKIFCIYGHGKETERSYWYARGEYEKEAPLADDPQAQCLDTSAECSAGITKRTPLLGLPRARKSWIDYSVNEDTSYSKVVNGVRIGEGDGTVSLISLGGMCVEGWKRPRWNPARIKVITHEMKHEPTSADIRGGATTSDHIDILGSTALNEAVLKIAAGRGNEIGDHFVSNIREYAKRVQWD